MVKQAVAWVLRIALIVVMVVGAAGLVRQHDQLTCLVEALT